MYKISSFGRKIFLPFVFMLCGLASIAHAEAKTNTTLAKASVEERIQDELEQLLKQVLTQLNGIDNILEELALLINNDQLAKGDNKKEIIDSIRSLRGLIDKIRSDSFVTIDLPSIYLMLQLNNSLMAHISKALTKGFHGLPVFDLEAEITKHIQVEPDFEKITETLAANTKQLGKLTKLANGAGLHWYNNAYRTFNQNVLEPAHKYKLGTIVGLTTASAALLWWYTDSKRLPWLRKYVGWHPHIDKNGLLDDPWHDGTYKPADKSTPISHPLETAGEFEKWCIHFTQGLMPYATFALPIVWLSCKQEITQAGEWLHKKTKSITNHLKGGIHEKEYEGITKKNPDIDFSNIIGNEKAKEEGRKVIKYMEDPERYDRYKMQVERGILLTGKTRTGKTYFAEALAGEIKRVMKAQGRNGVELGFYNIKASLINKHGIEYVLNLAKKEAPCVLFIDEIDLLRLQRVGGDCETLYAFLTSMSGCFERDLDKRVIIIGATNNPQNLDIALTARGRFGMKIEFTYPEFRERKLFLEARLNALTLNMKSFDLDKLARETEGCSYEDLLAIIREAFLQAKIKGAIINQALLEQALDSTVRNIVFEGQKELPEKEHRIIATHMAGHALAATLLPTSKKLTKVTTLPVMREIEEEAVWDTYSKKDKDSGDQKQKDGHITQYGQLFTYHDKDTLTLSDEAERIRLCTTELAGHIAEKLLLGSSGYSYHPEDSQKAYNLIKAVVFKGLQEKDLSEAEADRRKDDVLALLRKCETDALRLLEKNKPALQRLADTLDQKKILTAAQVEAIIKEESKPALALQAPELKLTSMPQTETKQQNTSQATAISTTAEIQKAMEQELGLPEVRTAQDDTGMTSASPAAEQAATATKELQENVLQSAAVIVTDAIKKAVEQLETPEVRTA